MFKCNKCHKVTKSREKQERVVVEKRDKEYWNGYKTSQGWEIKKEIFVCESCAEEIKRNTI
jgi:hypothetical protein